MIINETSSYELSSQTIKSLIYYSLPISGIALIFLGILTNSTKLQKIIKFVIPSIVLLTLFNGGILKFMNATAVWQTRTVLEENNSKRTEFQVQDVGALGYNKRTVEVKHITNFLMKVDKSPSTLVDSKMLNKSNLELNGHWHLFVNSRKNTEYFYKLNIQNDSLAYLDDVNYYTCLLYTSPSPRDRG